jgi:hypothetical protein
MTLDEIWEQINAAVQQGRPSDLATILRKIEDSGHPLSCELCFAAGYAAYMLPPEHPLKARAHFWLLETMLCQPGHIEAVLYLSYLLIDRQEWEKSLALLFAISAEDAIADGDLMDRLVEARVFALSKMQRWEHALAQLDWFDCRMEVEPDCGLGLINFFKLLDDFTLTSPVSDLVFQKISRIVQMARRPSPRG